jgi:hypothetical protein
MTLQPRYRLELLPTHTASFVVYIRSKNLVLGKVIVRVKVFVALVAVVMLVIVLLVPLHCFFRVKVQIAIGVCAFDQRWFNH